LSRPLLAPDPVCGRRSSGRRARLSSGLIRLVPLREQTEVGCHRGESRIAHWLPGRLVSTQDDPRSGHLPAAASRHSPVAPFPTGRSKGSVTTVAELERSNRSLRIQPSQRRGKTPGRTSWLGDGFGSPGHEPELIAEFEDTHPPSTPKLLSELLSGRLPTAVQTT
jgi:hypothetical protein